jgi:hypothetical protein
MSGFYEGGGYSGYGSGSQQTNASSGGYNYNNSVGSDGFSGSMGSSSTTNYPQQTQPMLQQTSNNGPVAAATTSFPHQTTQQQYNQYGQQQSAISNDGGNSMSGAMNFWNPAVAMAANAAITGQMGDLSSGAMMNVAETMGKEFLQKGWAKAIPGLERSMLGLRPYFAVDNKYVMKKMMKVLFPFFFTNWARKEKIEPSVDGRPIYALPQHDENAPDLYIPSMSLLTYVLLCALCYGNAGKFNPEVIPEVTYKCLGFQLLELIAIRIGFYLMEAPVAILDLLSYTGYKYLGLCVNMFIGLTMGQFLGYGNRSYYFTYLWTATSVSYFILKVMANSIPRRTSAAGPKRQFMVLGFASSQFATCWFVSQTKFLD